MPQLFEPTWNREYIESVQIIFKEEIGLGGRGGYFDNFGIIRDMMQSQLLQVMIWISMEPPEDMSAACIIDAKVELLRCIETLRWNPKECFLGQFGPSATEPGYLDDDTVPKDSRCPTFASLLLQVDNTRWRGVPFLMTAGKGLDERLCEVRAVRHRAAVGRQGGWISYYGHGHGSVGWCGTHGLVEWGISYYGHGHGSVGWWSPRGTPPRPDCDRTSRRLRRCASGTRRSRTTS